MLGEAGAQAPRLDPHDRVELRIEARHRPAEDLDRDHRLLERSQIAREHALDDVAQQSPVPRRAAKGGARLDAGERELDLLGGPGERSGVGKIALHGGAVRW